MRIYCTGQIYVTYHKTQFTDKVICNFQRKKNRLSLYIIHCYQKQNGANPLQNNLSFLSADNSRICNNKRLNNVQQDLNYMCHNDGCFTHRQESTN
jgi:hypothetical protein